MERKFHQMGRFMKVNGKMVRKTVTEDLSIVMGLFMLDNSFKTIRKDMVNIIGLMEENMKVKYYFYFF